MTFKFLVRSVHRRMPIRQTESLCELFPTRKRRDSAAPVLGVEVSTVPNQASARALEPDIVARLARFFPDATPVRIPIKLSRARSNGSCNGNGDGNGNDNNDNNNSDNNNDRGNGNGHLKARERENDSAFFQETVIEFGTPHEVLFAINRPLEFADRVLVESKDGTLHAEGSVVAVQYHPERTVVAVRFLKHVPNWILKS
jgi:hypothetical protein